ncbi:hypothetical protein BGX23_004381 [Mortierella sp. AD031]|nr:hypothetical protein BGX23_004381 [Mortierella sp. AD031]KAG0195765.1 hypothetical protein BGX33_002631 [Mortierella sp. NVP41]
MDATAANADPILRGQRDKWPPQPKEKLALRRRAQLFNVIKKEAKEKDQVMEAVIEEWMRNYPGKTVNNIFKAVLEASRQVGSVGPKEDMDMHADDEEQQQ